MYDEDKFIAASEDIKAKMLSGDRDLIKTASLAADDYFRTEIRENGIRRNITPPVQVSDDMLDYVEDTDFPVMLAEIAPRSAGAVLVSFETGPGNEVIHGKKTRIEFNRVMTPKYSIDKIRLKGYHMPLLDILYDLMLKDIMDREDYITMAVDDYICGTVNTNNTELGLRRFVTAGPVSREAVVHMKKGMYETPGHLQPAKYLMNYSTFCDFGVLSRDEVGGDLAQDMFVNGVTLTKLGGIETVVTTKYELVPNNIVYIYTTPKYYGGFYTLEDVSMVTDEQDDIWLSFFAHETIGASVVNAAGVAKVSLTGDIVAWQNG